MMGTTHLTIGVLLLFLISKYTNLIQGDGLWAVALLLLGSLLPDIDSASSILGRKFKRLKKLMKHRGVFHSIFAMVLFTVITYIILGERNLSLIFLIGYASHLIADSITKEGTSLFYPRSLNVKGPLRVGSFAETLIFILLIFVTVKLII